MTATPRTVEAQRIDMARRTPKSKQFGHLVVFFRANPDGPYVCVGCELEIMVDLNVHHADGDHSNNAEENLLPMHRACHCKEHAKGRKFSEETRERLSLSHQGQSPDEATRQKLSDALAGKPWSDARREAENGRY